MKDLTGIILGRYELKQRIGRGGMSVVYRATKGDDAQPDVAVKVMDTSTDTLDVFIRRFEQEARIVGRLNHPNVLPLLDYGHDQEYPYMVMPLMLGGTLADILRKNPLSQTDTGGWLYQIAMALDHAHSEGVIHRDLKPTNILLDDQGHAFLTDFGIARLMTLTSSLTMTGNVVGTPTYMAPEQWRGEEATPSTDIYGLGILVYLMLTGHPPFKADTPHSLMYKHLNEPPPSLTVFNPNLKASINAVIFKSIAKHPSERYRTAEDFSQDYQRALHDLETLAQREPPSPPKRSTTQYTAQIDTYRTPASLSVASPIRGDNAKSIPAPYNPNVLQPMAVHAPEPRQQNFTLRSCLLSLIIAALLVGVAAEVNRNPDAYLPQTVDSRVNDTVPQPTPTPDENNLPLVAVLSPQADGTFTTNSPVRMQLSAEGAQNVSRIEIRRFGYVLETLENTAGTRIFRTTHTYTPRQAGTHALEIIAYDGNTAGPSTFFQIEVR